MPFASTCACGRPTYSFGGLCDRCVALQTLGLDTSASDAQIENSYRTMVKVWHPDRFQHDPKLRGSAEEKLKEINAAHELLTSPEGVRSQPASKQQPPAQVEEVFEEESSQVADPEPEPEPGLETAEIRRILKRQRRGKISVPRFLLRLGFLIGAVATIAVLWLVVDSILMANPKTAGPWEQYKTELGRDLHSNGLRMWSNITGNLKNDNAAASPAVPAESAAAPSPAPASAVPESSKTPSGPPHVKDNGRNAKPYVTAGLTPMEVLTILGSPTSSSGEKMFYKGSEIDFKDGRVAGWNIDLKSAPIRVKLWPTSAPSSALSQIALGSSKSDVIAVQGTPNLFSDSKFGYGSSIVFFQNDRVTGWHEDPNSVRLRVAH